MGSFFDVAEVGPKLGEDTVKWPEEWLAKGEARGLERGRRCIPRREAKARFGTGAAAASAGHFDWADSPEALRRPRSNTPARLHGKSARAPAAVRAATQSAATAVG